MRKGDLLIPMARAVCMDISHLFEAQRRKSRLPALGGAVFSSSGMLGVGVSGVRKTNTLWHIGSCTKAMTATLVGLAVDRGVLRFTDTLSSLFPSTVIHGDLMHESVDSLLRHTGGMPADFPRPLWTRMHGMPDLRAGRAQIVDSLLRDPPAQAPGVFAYSNAGYVVLGAALELIEGCSWEEIMAARLFTPLGMATAGFGAPRRSNGEEALLGHTTLGWGCCSGFIPMDPSSAKADNPAVMGPAGTVHCSLEDWGRFLRVHLSWARGEPSAALPLSLATMEHLHAAAPGESYAGGWVVASRTWAHGKTLCHNGSNTLWHVAAWLAPGVDRALVAATNCGADPSAALEPLIKLEEFVG